MDKRPEWKHRNITEDQVRWLSRPIKKIAHHWTMTSEDTSDHWIVLTGADGKEHRLHSRFLNGGYFEFAPDHASLVSPTYQGRQAIQDLEAIDAWEKKNKRERAEFERLKKKFA